MNPHSVELIEGHSRVPIYQKPVTKPTKSLPSDIKNRLPHAVFTGPKNLYNHRAALSDFPHEIGIGQASGLRTLDMNYLTRDAGDVMLKRRNEMPGEVGWTAAYFSDLCAFSNNSLSYKRPDSFSVPR